MAHFKRPDTSNKNLTQPLFRMYLLLFIVLLSSHLSGNELPAQVKQEKITRLGLDLQIVTRYKSLLAVDQNRASPILQKSINQQVKTSLPQGKTMTLPQTGMASDLYQKVGFWMLLFAATFWIVERHFINVKTDNP